MSDLPPSEPGNSIIDSLLEKQEGVSRWCSSNGRFWGAKETNDRLPPGVYKPGYIDGTGVVLDKMIFKTDDLLNLPDSPSQEILAEFKRFWNLKDKFAEHGYIHKRGIFIYGPPGSGKTASINLMAKHLIEKEEGIIVYMDHPALGSAALQLIRRLEKDRPVVVILEDFDDLVERYGEAEYLAILDGEAQIGGVVFVATTNYPERFDDRIRNRPSRFDVHHFVDMPTDNDRRAYFEAKLKLPKEELDEWVELSHDFSVAHLREMVASYLCFGYAVKDTVARLRKMGEHKPNSDNYKRKNPTGFALSSTRERDRYGQKGF